MSKIAQAAKVVCPLPETVRGYGIHINTNQQDQLIYGNGKTVVIRSLAVRAILSLPLPCPLSLPFVSIARSVFLSF